jgi:equilibrative nucleoside transporter 1/2/3
LITTILVTQTVPATLLFWLTLISMCLCGLSGAILSGGLFGLAAMFPPSYTGALMNGQGVAGLFVALASLLTTLGAAPIDTCTDDGANNDDDSCPQGINYSALVYFIISTMILFSCISTYFVLQKLHFTRYCKIHHYFSLF